MNDRERLIELLSENFVEFCHVGLIAGNCKISAVTLEADKFADHLIANGVTVQKQGEWERFKLSSDDWALRLKCSNCKNIVYENGFHFCPHCSAKMVGDADVGQES